MKITRIAPLTYSPGKLQYHSFIRGGIGADYHQNPGFYQFPNGDLLLYWNAYDFDECSSNSVKLYSISRDRGLTWSDPQVYAADFPGGVIDYLTMLRIRGTNNALMFVTQNIYHAIEIDETRRVATAHSDYFQSKTRVYTRRSTDGGRSFGPCEQVPYALISGGKELPIVGFYGSNDCLIQLQSGRVLATFSFIDPARSMTVHGGYHFTVASLLSDDGGITWKRGGEIVTDLRRGVMEPQIVETEPNHLFCVFRNTSGLLYQTNSHDGGETWDQPTASASPSPESMPKMIQLRSGKALLVWNNASSVEQLPRHPISAAVSNNGGRTWSAPRILAVESGTNQLSNHGLIQLDDGRILAAISHYRDVRPMTSDLDLAIFDEAWLAV